MQSIAIILRLYPKQILARLLHIHHPLLKCHQMNEPGMQLHVCAEAVIKDVHHERVHSAV